MEIQGKWTKDEDGFMDFEPSQLQRLYEVITDRYHQVYNRYLDELDDEEQANLKALGDGYKMVTDYKIINGKEEFATSYTTPSHDMDIWYEQDPFSHKKDYNSGFIRITTK
jgi:hypothetical protein